MSKTDIDETEITSRAEAAKRATELAEQVENLLEKRGEDIKRVYGEKAFDLFKRLAEVDRKIARHLNVH